MTRWLSTVAPTQSAIQPHAGEGAPRRRAHHVAPSPMSSVRPAISTAAPRKERVVVEPPPAEADQELCPVGCVGRHGPHERCMGGAAVGHGAPERGPHQRVGEVVHGPDNTPTWRRVMGIPGVLGNDGRLAKEQSIAGCCKSLADRVPVMRG